MPGVSISNREYVCQISSHTTSLVKYFLGNNLLRGALIKVKPNYSPTLDN